MNNLDDTNEELKKLLRQLKYVSGDVGDSVSDTMENLDNLVLNMSKELKGLKDTIKIHLKTYLISWVQHFLH